MMEQKKKFRRCLPDEGGEQKLWLIWRIKGILGLVRRRLALYSLGSNKSESKIRRRSM